MYKPVNHIEQLAKYIKKNLKKGYTLDSLRFSLKNQGYSRISIENAINLTNIELAKEAPKIKEKPEIRYKVVEKEEQNLKDKEKKLDELNFKFPKKTWWKRLLKI